MKRISMLLVTVLICMVASAQITWNVKTGAGLATVVGADEGVEGKFGWKIGVGIEKPISADWLIMSSLEFKQKGTKVPPYDEGDYSEDADLSLTYLQLPILGAWRTRLNSELNMTLKAGPYFAYALSGKIKNTGSDGYSDEWDPFDDEVEGWKRFDGGVLLGIDLEYHRIVAGVEFEYGILPLCKDEEFDLTMRNMSLYVTLGYKF